MSSPPNLLLKLAAAQPETEGAVTGSSVDWQALYTLAARHRMVGVVAPVLLRILDGSLSPAAKTCWVEHWKKLAIVDLTQMARLEEVLSAAAGEGLHPLLLKGFSLHFQFYHAEETARGSSDLDLMVRPKEVLPMAACLKRLSFSFRGTDSWSRPVFNWAPFIQGDSEAMFQCARSSVVIDLHWRLCAPALERACEITLSDRIWRRNRTIPIGTTRVAVPGREEEVLMLCLHIFKGGTFVLRNLMDLVRAIRTDPPLDWDLLIQIGQETGTLGCAYYAFKLAEELVPQIIPQSLWTVLRQAAGPSWLLAPFLRIERLLRTQGERLTDLSTFWNGVLFANHPGRWIPYEIGRVVRWMDRRCCWVR